MPDVPQPPRFKLTIGEMFPADDLVAQWVFSLTSLAEDVAMVMGHLETEELREKMLFYRLLRPQPAGPFKRHFHAARSAFRHGSAGDAFTIDRRTSGALPLRRGRP